MSGLLSLYDRASLSFKIFDQLLFSMREVSSPIKFTQDWKVGETRSDLYEACSFVAKNRISSEAPDYLAEILIADASPDPSEPYIPDVEESTLEQVDNHLMTELWMDCQRVKKLDSANPSINSLMDEGLKMVRDRKMQEITARIKQCV